MNAPNKTSQLQSLGDARRNFLQAASAVSLGSAMSVLSPLATAQTTDRFVLVTVQLNLMPGKVEPLSKEVLENALKETRRFLVQWLRPMSPVPLSFGISTPDQNKS